MNDFDSFANDTIYNFPILAAPSSAETLLIVYLKKIDTHYFYRRELTRYPRILSKRQTSLTLQKNDFVYLVLTRNL